MTDWREELIEKMARALAQSHVNGLVYQDTARAALAVAEPVIREQADSALREENARLREEISRLTLAFVEAEKKAERDYLRFVDADREEIERLRNDLKNAIFSDLAYTKEIERQDVLLREENARLREALKPFAYIAKQVGDEDARWAVPSAHLRAADAAIREGG